MRSVRTTGAALTPLLTPTMAVGPIAFHRIHGENIRLSNGGRTAKRVDSFNKAICFTERPLRSNEKLIFKIAEVTQAWSGTLRVGVTVHDPLIHEGNLPKYCCPDLNMKPGNWGKALEQVDTAENTTFQIYYTANGHVMLKVNDGEAEVFVSGVQTNVPLYVLFDIYGNSMAVELLGVSTIRPPANTPRLSTAQRLISSVPLSDCFDVDLRPVDFSVVTSASVQAFGPVATSVKPSAGGKMAMIKTPLRAGEALIVRLNELRQNLPISLALSAVSPAEIRGFPTIEDLCDQTYSVLFQSGTTVAGEELAVVISELGVVHVSHANRKWLKCVHIDPAVQFYVVFDMQLIKKVTAVGVTNHLQAPSESPAGNGVVMKAPTVPQAPAPKPAGPSTDRPNTECVVCLENPRDTLLKPCLHFVLCSDCTRSLLQSPQRECPMCRVVIEDSQRIFMN